jgi:hypothetical protein
MPQTPGMTTEALSKLQRFLEANDATDWRTVSFEKRNDPDAREGGDRSGPEAEAAGLLPLLKAYQRVLRVLPPGEDARALPLLRAGLHSALQIARLPERDFARQWAALFPGEAALGEAVRRHALGRRSHVLLHHIHAVQSSEPHYRAARFW